MDKAMRIRNSGKTRELYQLDRDYHSAIIEASQNEWLQRTVDNLRDHFLRYENQIAYDAEVSSGRVLNEHKRILQSIKEGNPDEAEAAMESHLYEACDRTKYLG